MSKPTLFYVLGGSAIAIGMISAPLSISVAQDIVIPDPTMTITFAPAPTENLPSGSSGTDTHRPYVFGNGLLPYGLSPIGPLSNPTGNNVTINNVNNGVRVDDYVIGAYYHGDYTNTTGIANTASNNTVTLNGVSVGQYVAGGQVYGNPVITSTATGNTVTMNGGSVGYNSDGSLPSNPLTYTGNVYGGLAENSGQTVATNNSVVINGGTVSRRIYGGYANEGGVPTATGNSVTINGGSVGEYSSDYSVYGGYATGGTGVASNNTVTLNGGTVYRSVFGGYAEGVLHYDGSVDFATVAGNTVTVNDGATILYGVVYGGDSLYGNATGNTVNINNGVLGSGEYVGSGTIVGGHASAGNANGNAVNINMSADAAVPSYSGANSTVYGGWAEYGLYAIDNLSLSASDNQVTINDHRVAGAAPSLYDYVFGGYAAASIGTGNATASGNTVTINDGNKINEIDGGHAESAGMATASNNSVNINGGTVNTISSGLAIASALNGTAVASGNSVNINGGTVVGDVYGGQANANSFSPGTAVGTAEASGNNVNITGGTVNGNVYGGAASGITIAATNNTVTISGNPTFGVGGTGTGPVIVPVTEPDDTISPVNASNSNSVGAVTNTTNTTPSVGPNPPPSVTPPEEETGGGTPTTNLYGGYSSGGPGDVRSGNTLNLHTPIAVNSVQNFENWNFYLPSNIGNGDTMLTVTGLADLGDQAKVSVAFDGASSPLQVGDTVKLISAGTLSGTLGNTTTQGGFSQGVTLLYDFDLGASNNQLLATVTNIGTNPQAKALSEGIIAGPALLLQGADLVAGQGVTQAVEAAGGTTQGSSQQTSLGSGYGIGTFASVGGGSINSDTGSHVDMSSISLLAGVAAGTNLSPGRLTLAAFFEYGNGSYDTYNSFTNAASIHGDGDIYHLGGGILGRLDTSDTGPGHVYLEASLRAGGVHNDYNGGDLRDAFGRRADYDSSAAYYGAHAGFGYLWNITQPASLDVYAKYFWTRQEGDDVTLSTGDSVNFQSVDSHRLRLGGRFAYAVNNLISPYVGAAYEHEFDGKAKATAYGYDLDAPALNGDTGIGELGLVVKPSQKLPLSCDIGVQGYVGKREGVTGTLQVRYEF